MPERERRQLGESRSENSFRDTRPPVGIRKACRNINNALYILSAALNHVSMITSEIVRPPALDDVSFDVENANTCRNGWDPHSLAHSLVRICFRAVLGEED